MVATVAKPNFIIIGAQKAGTTWLWEMLDQHPGTSLPEKKEIHFFGSSEIYKKGLGWYLDHFKNLDSTKVVGEASTSYFYDNVPYFYNNSRKIEFDTALPTVPELILEELPDVKIIIMLRDPVTRAISSYKHYMRKGNLSPIPGLKRTATEHPKLRILEFGYYPKYLEVWKRIIPNDQLKVIVFEEDVVKKSIETLNDVFAFLGVDSQFKPEHPDKPVHKGWNWTRIVFNYYARRIFPGRSFSRIGKLLDSRNILAGSGVSNEDIEFLRSIYLPQKEDLEKLLNRNLDSWKYGT